ncbi:MAG: hypothetical protein IKV36_04490 [Clostridia bacterium]|nr:hypothetical protein [Clostridia bacterium]
MKRIIAMLLVVTTLFTTFAINVSAAAAEEFISEVALIYEDSVEDAKKAIEGTDWKLFEQDLNPKADYMIDDGVYLIYKTSTNVEDAITDLRVMDMYGGYSTSNYENQLEKTRSAYLAVVKELRIAAAEFKACYDSGSKMALLAYRQMNYYKDVMTEGGTETDMLMGDFFLNMPSDEKVVQVLMEGNTFAVNNLISLLAVGISSEGASSLASRVADQFAVKDTLTDAEYYDAAVVLSEIFTEMRAKILRYDALKEDHNLEDEDITEEEYQFMIEYAAIAVLLDSIQLGETSLADLLRGGVFTEKDFYPIAAALTEGQRALVNMGQIETVLKYNSPSSAIEDLEAMLDEIEKPYLDANGVFKTIDVYTGVDRSIFRGNFAMTTEAARQQALTGETWDLGKAAGDSVQMYAVAGMFVLAECVLVGTMIGHKVTIASLAALANANYNHAIANAYFTAESTWASFAPAVQGMCVGVALIIVGLVGISTWYNYYNPSYTVIPNTMIDVRETDLGDKYIKYTAAKVFENGNLSKKNADFNAYEGKEWNALYYTKDATAGNCLTPKFVYKDNDATIARRHQGISMFGETKAFNLNSHVYNDNAPGVYVTIRYSNTKKAAADLPSVVGSMFATGALYALTALAGAGVGVGGTILLQNAKKKKKEKELVPENSNEM